MSKLKDGAMLQIIKDEATVISRCIVLSKAYREFFFFPAKDMMYGFRNHRKSWVKNRRGIKITIHGIKNDREARMWRDKINEIVKDTIYHSSKCYQLKMFNDVNYYLSIHWKEFIDGEFKDYVVPPPPVKE